MMEKKNIYRKWNGEVRIKKKGEMDLINKEIIGLKFKKILRKKRVARNKIYRYLVEYYYLEDWNWNIVKKGKMDIEEDICENIYECSEALVSGNEEVEKVWYDFIETYSELTEEPIEFYGVELSKCQFRDHWGEYLKMDYIYRRMLGECRGKGKGWMSGRGYKIKDYKNIHGDNKCLDLGFITPERSKDEFDYMYYGINGTQKEGIVMGDMVRYYNYVGVKQKISVLKVSEVLPMVLLSREELSKKGCSVEVVRSYKDGLCKLLEIGESGMDEYLVETALLYLLDKGFVYIDFDLVGRFFMEEYLKVEEERERELKENKLKYEMLKKEEEELKPWLLEEMEEEGNEGIALRELNVDRWDRHIPMNSEEQLEMFKNYYNMKGRELDIEKSYPRNKSKVLFDLRELGDRLKEEHENEEEFGVSLENPIWYNNKKEKLRKMEKYFGDIEIWKEPKSVEHKGINMEDDINYLELIEKYEGSMKQFRSTRKPLGSFMSPFVNMGLKKDLYYLRFARTSLGKRLVVDYLTAKEMVEEKEESEEMDIIEKELTYKKVVKNKPLKVIERLNKRLGKLKMVLKVMKSFYEKFGGMIKKVDKLRKIRYRVEEYPVYICSKVNLRIYYYVRIKNYGIVKRIEKKQEGIESLFIKKVVKRHYLGVSILCELTRLFLYDFLYRLIVCGSVWWLYNILLSLLRPILLVTYIWVHIRPCIRYTYIRVKAWVEYSLCKRMVGAFSRTILPYTEAGDAEGKVDNISRRLAFKIRNFHTPDCNPGSYLLEILYEKWEVGKEKLLKIGVWFKKLTINLLKGVIYVSVGFIVELYKERKRRKR